MGHALRTIAEVAAPIAGIALGPELFGAGTLLDLGATAAPALGGALGGGLGSEIGGGNPLLGAAEGGAGGLFSGLGGFEGLGNTVGGLFGNPTFGTDIGTGISNAASGVGDTLGSAFGLGGNPAYSDPSITGQFAQGLGSGSTTEFTPSGAGGSIGTLGGGFSPSITGAGSLGGGTAGGFLQGLDQGSLAAGNSGGGFLSPTLGAVDNASASGLVGGSGNVLSQAGAYNALPWQSADTAANAQTLANLPNPNFDTSALSSPIGTNTAANAFNPTGGNVELNSIGNGNKGLFGSLLGGGGTGNNMLNGLLRTGLSGLFSQNPYKGLSGVGSTLTNQAQQYNPYIQAGGQAQNALANLYGLNGNGAQAAAQANWQNTPGYQFQLNQGLGALQNSAAANGGLLTGNTMQALQNYGQGLANTTYNQYLGNLQQQAGQGASAISPQAQLLGEGGTLSAAPGIYNTNRNNQLLGGLFGSLFPSQGQNMLGGLFG